MPEPKERIGYKGNKELFRRAKAQAALEGKAVGYWIDQAIVEKLSRIRR